jgi:hypothetical protein
MAGFLHRHRIAPTVVSLFLAITCLWPSLFVAAVSASPDAGGALLHFGPGFDLSKLTYKDAEATLGGTGDAPTLRIKTHANTFWPGVVVPAPGGHWDLSPYQFITVDIHNTDTHDIDVNVRVDNPGADGQHHCMSERIGTQPDQRVRLTIILKRMSASPIKLWGMQGFPQDLYASGGIDPANITALVFYTEKGNPSDSSFEISNVRVSGRYEKPAWDGLSPEQFFPFIDSFGQFRWKDWPGKIHSEADLQARRDAEAKELAATGAGPADWDKWGGWANGPTLPATGYFRTAKVRDKWWLVDPDGHLFFSVGLTGVGLGGEATPIEDRENWFQGLPAAPSDPLSAFLIPHMKTWAGLEHYGTRQPRGFNIVQANLFRKYGPQWRTIYADLLPRRLRAWGVNTLGNWSDSHVEKMDRTPYTCTFFYDVPNLKGGHTKFPDVFDPHFAAALEAGAKQFVGWTAHDPWCLGYFVDNEMAWGGETTLGEDALDSPAPQAAKQKLAAWLQARYPSIGALNAAWGTAWSSWDAFAADTEAQPHTDAATRDLTAFTGLTADTYFRSVRDAIRKVAPNHLYLGCRSVGGAPNVVDAAVKYCDVVSYNRYCASVRDARLPNGHDAPMMVGEFHFGAPDRGPFSTGLFSADDQADRGRKLAAYINSGLDNPQMVGVHWFQYADEPTSGRIDGENAQCGFVDICDTPYVETIQAARATADLMYSRRGSR